MGICWDDAPKKRKFFDTLQYASRIMRDHHHLLHIACHISHYILSQYKYQVSQYKQFIQSVIFDTIFMVMNHVEASRLGI